MKSLVEVSSAYEIENVLVTRNEPKYKCTEHRFKLNLIDKTNFTKIVGTKIPVNHFDFMPFGDILESDKEEKTVGAFYLLFAYFFRYIFEPRLWYITWHQLLRTRNNINFMTDVIGHVVEKDVIKEKDVNGRRSKLIDITLQDSEYVLMNFILRILS